MADSFKKVANRKTTRIRTRNVTEARSSSKKTAAQKAQFKAAVSSGSLPSGAGQDVPF